MKIFNEKTGRVQREEAEYLVKHIVIKVLSEIGKIKDKEIFRK
jgi:hypothetical protein